jgi:pyruvate formate-lyase activating enzyme-like uncharacterized protein
MKSAVEWLEDTFKRVLTFDETQQKKIDSMFAKAKEIEHRKDINEAAKMFAKIDGLGLTKGLRDYMEGRYQDVINYKKQNFGEEHD